MRTLFKKLEGEKHLLDRGAWGSLFTDTSPLYQGEPLTLSEKHSKYNDLSNFFMRAERLRAGYKKGTPPYEYWEGAKANRNSLSRLTGLFMKPALSKSSLYDAFSNDSSIRTVTQFKPHCAKHLYDFFGAKNVLDFSAGWGDRLVGFLASGAESYIGIDPNTRVHTPYQGIADFYAPHKKTRFICSPAEEVDYSTLEYDFVFTSPPYFDLEIYSSEATQSCHRYSNLEAWKTHFLYKVLRSVSEFLVEGGRIAINISDYNNGSGKTLICSDLLSYMGGSLGLTYEGCIGYPLVARQGVEAKNVGEPIFIWSKGRAQEPNWASPTFFW
jgi:16S rRNA G966 N2-methylase RsmD